MQRRFSDFYLKNNLLAVKDWACAVFLDDCKSIRAYLYICIRIQTYFDSFGVEYIPKEIKKFIGKNNSTANIKNTCTEHKHLIQ